MNIKIMMQKTAAIAIVVFALAGCNKDFETLGTNVIGEPGFNADLYEDALVSATTVNLPPVQTNNLPINSLGYNPDGLFGDQTASILTQLNLSITDPDFGENPVLDSVVLNIPYFFNEKESDTVENTEYELDSIYGNSPIKLSIIQSNLYLIDFDPETDFEAAQKYYSNMQPKIADNLGRTLYENSNFLPSEQGYTIYPQNLEDEADTVQLTPRMRIKLPPLFFQENIIDMQGSPELSSNNNFENFIRGLYLKAEAVNGKGSFMLLDLKHEEAGITLYYTSEVQDLGDIDEDDNTSETVEKPDSFKLTFGPNIVNTFKQEPPSFQDANLYLKGGEGAMAIIELFSGVDSDGDGVSNELEAIRENNWLINEANLTFYVNQSVLTGQNEPEHLFIYNVETNSLLADYVLDNPPDPNPPSSKSNNLHLEPLTRNENEQGQYYKIRISQHINNIINNDSTNVKLGLVVAQNVNVISNAAVLEAEGTALDKVPTTSVISPAGTVLYGPNHENEEKRLKLRIYYSEPKK